jgi:hypothetical protein
MVSFAVRPNATAELLILAAVAAADPAFCQEGPLAGAPDALVDEIAEIQAEHGLNSPDLLDPLTALALFYRERGNDAQAMATVERARHVVSVNYGLHTVEEALFIRQLVQIEAARGNAAGAWHLEQEMLAQIRRHPNDVRTAPILREVADRRTKVLRRYTDGEFPEELYLGCYYSWDRQSSCHAGDRRTVIDAMGAEAYLLRREADGIVARNARWLTSPCVRPQRPEIPEELSRRQKNSVELQTSSYLSRMQDYTGCLEARYRFAASNGADAAELSQLVAASEAAVEELEGLLVAYEERIGNVEHLHR